VAMALLASFVLWYHAARLNRRSAALRVLTSDDQRRLLGQAERARQELQRMLDSLAEQGHAAGAALPVRRQVFPLRDWLGALVEEVRPMAAASGLTLRFRCPEAMTDSDPHLLRRLLRNLLVNAVRHTRTGGVLVGVRRRGKRWRITVWDTGPGIPAAARERIFAAFVRLRADGEGQGLGLSIVRQLALTLDHPLDLASREGRGSAFSVDVPRVDPQPGWVLVVDDDPGGRQALGEILRAEGLQVVTTAGWIEPPRRWPAPAWVISDYHLGETRGTALVARLRERYGAVPALLVSGDPEAGAQGLPCLPKPVDPRALRRALGLTPAQ